MRAEAIAKKLALDLTDIIFINDVVAIQKMIEGQIASDAAVTYLFIVKQDQKVLAHTFKGGIPGDLISLNLLKTGTQSQTIKVISETKER